MAENSSIEWTDSTWNPIVAVMPDGKIGFHCEKISPACAHCYAATMNMRNLPARGTGLDYLPVNRDKVDIQVHFDTLVKPVHWKQGRKVFVCSMTDLFAEFVPLELIDHVFAVMALCRRHTFQVLTKRPERMAEYFEDLDDARDRIGAAAGTLLDGDWIWKRGLRFRDSIENLMDECEGLKCHEDGSEEQIPNLELPLPNVWLGVTAENQTQFDLRRPYLNRCPAARKFLSIEPLLGSINLTNRCRSTNGYQHGPESQCTMKVGHEGNHNALRPTSGWGSDQPRFEPGIDWVIVGGESGHGARPMNPQWVRDIRDQCQAAGIPFFFKQWGTWLPCEIGQAPTWDAASGTESIDGHTLPDLTDHRPVDGWWWPVEFAAEGVIFRRMSKSATRMLDGREWSEFPEVTDAHDV